MLCRRIPVRPIRRAVFYGSRLISAQKETEFSGSDYNGVKKVYTIWICMESPIEKSVINHYRLTERQVFGKYKEPQDNYLKLPTPIIDEVP